MTKLPADFAILCNRANLTLSLSLVRVSRARTEHHPAITEGVAAPSKQIVVTPALSWLVKIWGTFCVRTAHYAKTSVQVARVLFRTQLVETSEGRTDIVGLFRIRVDVVKPTN